MTSNGSTGPRRRSWRSWPAVWGRSQSAWSWGLVSRAGGSRGCRRGPLAAAEPLGDPVLVWRAAGRLGIGAGAARPAVEAGLLDFGARVRFRHPLVRSAAYRSASAQDRHEAHQALGEVTDPAIDPDRRA